MILEQDTNSFFNRVFWQFASAHNQAALHI